jgi:hypothetical protein
LGKLSLPHHSKKFNISLSLPRRFSERSDGARILGMLPDFKKFTLARWFSKKGKFECGRVNPLLNPAASSL